MKGNERPKHVDMTRQRFGRLTCIAFDHRDENNRGAIWKVRCDCGVEFLAYRINLINGSTRSCGCLRKDMLHNRKKSI